MKLVVVSRTPGIITLPSGSFTSSQTFHSWAWRGFAPSKEIAWGGAFKTTFTISLKGTS